ncbi:hypothetical protein QFZ75_007221 [Streptomyces sp. V3I8]|uniref:hypothetical protein n=1 Tax=Streptomyces sp. V3I8 TaxID=3042279 RepID=UPI002781ECFF|nr:hypothetical protein [Streptomyces sp. V3I8]MDQ1040805.1 hypothetical protein [Streptomyces sp. V3I8]
MTTPGFRPTHVVPPDGMPARDAPDPVRPVTPLDPFLPVRLVERHGDWGHVLCANGWSAWVDGRLLVAVPREPPAAGQPLARTADPRPLLARAEEALGRYRRAVEDLAAGHLDGAQFHARTRDLRAGIVVEGEAMWLYEAEHERWVYCDGTRLCTYAAPEPSDAPSAPSIPSTSDAPSTPSTSGFEPPGTAGHAPTRVVPGAAPEPTRTVPAAGPGFTEAVPAPAAKTPRAGEETGHAPTRIVGGDG